MKFVTISSIENRQMQPKTSYRIWHAPRVGSSLLCQLLEDTGLAGKPGEHLSLHGNPSLCEKYGVKTYEGLRDHVWNLGTDKAGIFAAKVSSHASYHLEIISEICALRRKPIPTSYEELWSDFFPDCKHIVIIRLNKVRQIVSWWKAIQDNEWHLRGEEVRKTPPEFYEDKFDINAFMHLYHEAVLRDAANQEYIAQNNLSAITVTYEDLIADPEATLNRCLHWLELTQDWIEVPKMRYKQTANDHSEIWVQRLYEDLQKDWEKKAVSIHS